jgi:ABC-2 type transport system permease protein
MKALSIAFNAVRRLFRDRSSIFFVFIFPMLLIVVIGASFGGEFKPRLGVYRESSGAYSGALVARLDADPSIVVETVRNVAALESEVERGRFEAGLVVRAGYDDALDAAGSTRLEFIGSNNLSSQQLRSTVQAAVTEENIELQAAQALGGDVQSAIATVEAVRPVAGDVRVTVTATGEAVLPATLGRFDLGATQELLLFVFLASLAGSVALVQTRRWGVARRMVSTPTSTRTIIGGEALGRFAVAMVQGVFIMLGSLLFFGVNWGDPLGAIAILVVFCAAGAGAGMLFGSTFQNDQQASSVGIFAALGLAALGGCMMPLDFFNDSMRTVAHITPHAWGLDAFAELVRRNATILDILPELGVLAAFAIVLLGLASWQLRRTLTA